MNPTRLLKLNDCQRREYILKEIKYLPIQALRSYASEYGIIGVSWMNKAELLDVIVCGLVAWAEQESLR